MSALRDWTDITVSQKVVHQAWSTTLPILNGFSEFFRWQPLWKICDKTIITDLTTPKCWILKILKNWRSYRSSLVYCCFGGDSVDGVRVRPRWSRVAGYSIQYSTLCVLLANWSYTESSVSVAVPLTRGTLCCADSCCGHDTLVSVRLTTDHTLSDHTDHTDWPVLCPVRRRWLRPMLNEFPSDRNYKSHLAVHADRKKHLTVYTSSVFNVWCTIAFKLCFTFFLLLYIIMSPCVIRMRGALASISIRYMIRYDEFPSCRIVE